MPPPIVSPHPAGSSFAVHTGYNTGVFEYRQFRAATDGYPPSKVRWAIFSDAKAAGLYVKTGKCPDGVAPIATSGAALPTPEASPELEAPPVSIPSSSQARSRPSSKSVRLTSSQPSRPPPAPKKALVATESDDEGGDTEPEDENPFAPETRSLPGPRPLVKATSVSSALRRGLSAGQVTAPNIIDGPSHVGAGTSDAKIGNSKAPVPVATPVVTSPPAPVVAPSPVPARTPKRTKGLAIQTGPVPVPVEIVPAPAPEPEPAPAPAPSMPELKVKSPPAHGSYTMCNGCHGTGWKLTPGEGPHQSHAPVVPTAPQPRSVFATPALPPQAPLAPAAAPAPYNTPGPSVTPAAAQFATPVRVPRRRRATASESDSSTSGLRLVSVGGGPDRRVKTIRTVSDPVARRDKGKGKASDNIIYRPYKFM